MSEKALDDAELDEPTKCRDCVFFVRSCCEQLRHTKSLLPGALITESLVFSTTANSGANCETYEAKQ